MSDRSYWVKCSLWLLYHTMRLFLKHLNMLLTLILKKKIIDSTLNYLLLLLLLIIRIHFYIGLLLYWAMSL
jgi:hypothetical protein